MRGKSSGLLGIAHLALEQVTWNGFQISAPLSASSSKFLDCGVAASAEAYL